MKQILKLIIAVIVVKSSQEKTICSSIEKEFTSFTTFTFRQQGLSLKKAVYRIFVLLTLDQSIEDLNHIWSVDPAIKRKKKSTLILRTSFSAIFVKSRILTKTAGGGILNGNTELLNQENSTVLNARLTLHMNPLF